MKKNYKRVYGYAIIMVVCVLLIVLVACLSENRITGYRDDYETKIKGHQEQIEVLQENITKLAQENAELKKKAEETAALQSQLENGEQALSDMKDIYRQYKEGNRTEAKNSFAKIEPIGFDDASLAYYELLKDFLNKGE